MTTEDILNRLNSFKERNKFSTKAWNDRGLNPSGYELCDQFTIFFNSCTDDLINAVKKGTSDRQLRKILIAALSSLRRSHYDTEEKEFICDLFLELSGIVEVDVKYDLSKWLYGPVLAVLVKINSIIRPERILETIKNPCNNCHTALESHIIQKENGIPAYSYHIVKCASCGELNLLSPGPNIKQLKFGNYQLVETLSKDEFNDDQAMTRLEQIKFFRK